MPRHQRHRLLLSSPRVYQPGSRLCLAVALTTGHTRKAHQTDHWNGRLCNASSSYPILDNWGRTFRSLTIINRCGGNLTVNFAICVFKGSLGQPSGGLRQCETDPLLTSFSQLTFLTLNYGTVGFWYPSTGNLSVVVFWCGSNDQLTTWGGRVVCL